MERVLSVFCDESGDFGDYSPHSPYYLLTLIIHDQSFPIDNAVENLNQSLMQEGFAIDEAIHTGPLIRREAPYANLDLRDRKRLFSHIEHFARSCSIRSKTIFVEKHVFGGGTGLSERIARQLGSFMRDNLSFFQSFDKVIVYYDRGQKEISTALRLIFSSSISNVGFRTVAPVDYRLFQVADLVCTLELLCHKHERNELSKSEIAFFDNYRNLKKNHLKLLDRIRFQ